MKAIKNSLVCALLLSCLAAAPAVAADMGSIANLLESLSDMTRAADRAHEDYLSAVNGGRDYSRYERDWRNRESSLERERIRIMARVADVPESRIRAMREEGRSWASIARRYNLDDDRFYGSSRYDRERDQWRGTPPGLAKKGGMPPGQAKKMYQDSDFGRGHGKGHGKGHDKW